MTVRSFNSVCLGGLFFGISFFLMSSLQAQSLSCQISTLYPGQSVYIGNQQIRCVGDSYGGGCQDQVTKACGCERDLNGPHKLILFVINHATGKTTQATLGSYNFKSDCENGLNNHPSCR
jgi:hypothetical protein